MKKALFISLCAAASILTGCNKNETEEPLILKNESFKGTMEVIQADNSKFTTNDIQVEITVNGDNTIDLIMKNVKFSSKMPVKLDMTIKGISYLVSEKEMVISGTGLIPWAMGGEFPRYTITNLSGTIYDETISFSMECGGFPLTYSGTKNQE